MDALRRQRTILTACLNGYLSKASIDPGSRYCPAHPGVCKHARWHSHGNWTARVTILPCALPPPFVLPASLRKAHALSAASTRFSLALLMPAHPGACKHARWLSHGNWAARVTILPCALPPPFVLPASL